MAKTARAPFDRLVDQCVWVGDCLVYQGSGPRGYGTFRATTNAKDRKAYVHRWIYENTVGPIPPGHQIDHVRDRGCRSTKCINPDHLEPVGGVINQNRTRLVLCRSKRHDLTDPANVRWDSQGRRRGCIVCHREKALARYHASR